MAISRDVKSSLLLILEEIPCPRSVAVAILLRHDEYGQIADLAVDPADHLTADSYWRAKQASDILRKARDLPAGLNPEQKAIESFYASEHRCKATNDRLDKFLHNGPFGPEEVRIADFFDDVKRLIKTALGPVPDLPSGMFGPGSTYGDKGSYNTLPDKLSNNPQFTPGAWIALSSYAATLWRRGERTPDGSPFPGGICRGTGPDPVCVPGNRFTTVPKSAKTDRGIAVEPSLNVYYQLPVGLHIKKRLIHQGINLFHGKETHMRLAREGSRSGEIATVDLSSASDTLAKKLVQLLVPSDWYDLLYGLRSPKTFIEGRWHHLEKFSSMGNGFTFELETLIFWALSRKALEWSGSSVTPLFVYGDDIIIPNGAYRAVTSVLEYCGFSVNDEKSFHTGLFRESCGGDYFNGHAVETAKLEELPSTPEAWIILLNNLHRVDPDRLYFKRSRQYILGLLPIHIRACKGPVELGDLVIHSDKGWQTRWDPKCPWIRQIRVWAPVGKTKSLVHWNRRVQVASLFCGIPGDGFQPRGWVSGYKLKWVRYS